MMPRDRIARDKATKIAERKFEITPDQVGESVLNTSGGVMKSTSPTFYDAQTDPVRNVLVDSSQVAPKDESKLQWFRMNKHERAAYVGSISGHTAVTVGMLEKYMQANQNDPNLNQDVTLFLIQVLAVRIKKGYHGFIEITDVLQAPEIQELFSKYGVRIDLKRDFSENPEMAHYLEYVINDAAVYAQTLIASTFFNSKPAESPTKR